MTRLLSFLFILWILTSPGCVYTDVDTDINVEINTNVNIYSAIKGEAAVTVELCQDLQASSPEPEDPKDKDSGLLGKWETCDSHDQCETGLCFCYM